MLNIGRQDGSVTLKPTVCSVKFRQDQFRFAIRIIQGQPGHSVLYQIQ